LEGPGSFCFIASIGLGPPPSSGPKDKLDNTEFSQPALYLAGLAAVEMLRASGPEGAEAVANCSVTAGLSLGEYSALVFAGAMSFEDGLKARARTLLHMLPDR
jgi:[acyl-carrier-protein] S-malonyltransferase